MLTRAHTPSLICWTFETNVSEQMTSFAAAATSSTSTSTTTTTAATATTTTSDHSDVRSHFLSDTSEQQQIISHKTIKQFSFIF